MSHAPYIKLYNKIMPKLLLLSCCAPCSCAVIESLHKQGRDFAVLFYNPNIAPRAEYEKRKAENKRFCGLLSVPFFDLDYDNDAWLDATRGLEGEPERGERCRKCFALRLRRAAQFAKANNFDIFTSVLGLSRHKNLDDVNAIAAEISKEFRLPYDDTNWRKNGITERGRALIKQHNIYEQNYCGCLQSQKLH